MTPPSQSARNWKFTQAQALATAEPAPVQRLIAALAALVGQRLALGGALAVVIEAAVDGLLADAPAPEERNGHHLDDGSYYLGIWYIPPDPTQPEAGPTDGLISAGGGAPGAAWETEYRLRCYADGANTVERHLPATAPRPRCWPT